MKKRLIAALLPALLLWSCTHSPQPVPDSNHPGNRSTTDPANPSFKTDILPVFLTYCSGCHNNTTASDGYNFTSYATITARNFSPGNPGDTKLYEAITDDDEDERMPQRPNPRLASEKIGLIRNWILNGAPNN